MPGGGGGGDGGGRGKRGDRIPNEFPYLSFFSTFILVTPLIHNNNHLYFMKLHCKKAIPIDLRTRPLGGGRGGGRSRKKKLVRTKRVSDEDEEVTLLSRDDDDADGGGAVSVKKGDNSGFETESVVKRGGGHVDVEGDDDDDGDENDEDDALPALALHKQQTVIEVFTCKTPSPARETAAAAASGTRFNACPLITFFAESLLTFDFNFDVINDYDTKPIEAVKISKHHWISQGNIKTVPWNREGVRRGEKKNLRLSAPRLHCQISRDALLSWRACK